MEIIHRIKSKTEEREGMPLACEKVEPAEEERAVKREEARMKGGERGWEGEKTGRNRASYKSITGWGRGRGRRNAISYTTPM